MNLAEFVQHVAEAMPRLDADAVARPDVQYLPGLGTMGEGAFRDAVRAYLAEHHASAYPRLHAEVPYAGLRGAKCDLCIGPADPAARFEWAVELKKVAFVGDNGKNNDFGPSKVVSPYRIHRSSVLDAERLQANRPAARGAVLMYGFDFDREVVEIGRALCVEAGIPIDRVDALSDVLDRNGGDYLVEPTFLMFEQMPTQARFRLSPRVQAPFGPLHRHPIYLKGHVAAWEILAPEQATGAGR